MRLGILKLGPGEYIMDFGFKVNDRYFSLTVAGDSLVGMVRFTGVITENQLETSIMNVDRISSDSAFYLIVY